MRRNIGSLLGGLVGFAVAYFGVGAMLSAPPGTTAPLRAETPAPARAPDHEAASLVAPDGSTEPHDASAGTPSAGVEPAAIPSAIKPASDDVGPRGFLLHGIVSARGGAALQGASLGVQLPTGGRVATTTDTLGRYTLGPLEPRAWSVTAGMRDHHAVSVDVAPPEDGTLARRDFELAPQQVVRVRIVTSDIAALYATVRGRALDAAGGGAVAAQAFLNEDPFVHGDVGAAADPSSGEFTVERALPGQRWLIVKCDGYAEVKRKINVPRGNTFEAGDVLMHRPVALSGKVQDSEGKPFEAVIEWGVLDPASGTVTWAQQVSGRSQADGTFSVRGLEPAVYVVRSPGLEGRGARPSDPRVISRPVRVDARTGSVDSIVLVLESTMVLTLVAPKRLQPSGGSWVHAAVLDAAGLPIARGWPGRYAEETPLHVPQGEWTLVLTRDGVELERRALVVSDAPLRIELEL